MQVLFGFWLPGLDSRMPRNYLKNININGAFLQEPTEMPTGFALLALLETCG
jgi:hypothetical protein